MGVTGGRKERIRENMKREKNKRRGHGDIASLSLVHVFLWSVFFRQPD